MLRLRTFFAAMVYGDLWVRGRLGWVRFGNQRLPPAVK